MVHGPWSMDMDYGVSGGPLATVIGAGPSFAHSRHMHATSWMRGRSWTPEPLATGYSHIDWTVSRVGACARMDHLHRARAARPDACPVGDSHRAPAIVPGSRHAAAGSPYADIGSLRADLGS